jgi:hypothetical protein
VKLVRGSQSVSVRYKETPRGPADTMQAPPRTQSMSRPCDSKAPPTGSQSTGQSVSQPVSQSVSQSVFVTKTPREAQPTPCKPRDPIHDQPL